MGNLTYRDSLHPDGPRHYLDGAPVNCGQGMDVLTPLGWLPGRFELAHRRPQAEDGELVEEGRVPMFYARFPIARDGGYAIGALGEPVCFELSPRHVLRWPERNAYDREDQLAEGPPAMARWGYCPECDGPLPPGGKLCVACRAEMH